MVADDSAHAETNAESGRGRTATPVAGWIHALPRVRGEGPLRQVRRFDEHMVVLWQGRERWTSAGHVPPRRSG